MRSLVRLIEVIILLIALTSVTCAEEADFDRVRHAVGFNISSSMGPGLVYRYYSSGSFVQGSFFTRITSRDDIADIAMGVTYGHVLSEISIVKALPPTTLVFVTSIDGLYSKGHQDIHNDTELRNEKSAHAGVGIALEMGNTFSPGLLFSIGTTYALVIEKRGRDKEWNLGPQLNVGMLYNW